MDCEIKEVEHKKTDSVVDIVLKKIQRTGTLTRRPRRDFDK